MSSSWGWRGRVWVGWPQASNQPGQYSETKRGLPGGRLRGRPCRADGCDAEVDAGVDAGDAAGGEAVVSIDGIEEGTGEAGAEEDVAHVGHVGMGWGRLGAEASVLVFNLGDEDGPPWPIWRGRSPGRGE